MIYPSNFEEKIGFSKIKNQIKALCISEMGKLYADKMFFSNRKEIVDTWLSQTLELKNMLSFDKGFPQQNFFDLTLTLKRIQIAGTYIEVEELFDLLLSLQTMKQIADFFDHSDEEMYPELKKIVLNFGFNPQIITEADSIMNRKGEIKDHASDMLYKIRTELRQQQNSIERTLNKTLKEVKDAGWIVPETKPSIRNGRSVIPVPATYKRQLNGFIHDVSATGQTVYIEPAAVFEINNKIRELENAERREVIKILTNYTNNIRPYVPELIHAYRYLAIIDFMLAKAKFALKINGNKPQIAEKPHLYLEETYHPLLYLSHKEQNKLVVPLNLKLDTKERILVISGPNAGGKSVCLKTVGLIQYMFQCGILIPTHENSKLGIFNMIFLNIGDEQSLENDLSTYSSHLKHMNYLLKHAKPDSLFLIDEYGSGTEPQIGGAIAETVLEAINRKKPFGVITTHYANLKKLADEQEGMINGAMLFDNQKMQPLFVLKMGRPGSSFAFEIAEKIGIPKKILQKAEKKIDNTQVMFDKQLQQLEVDRRKLKQKEQTLTVADEFLAEMINKYENLNKSLENKKNTMIKNARQEAKTILDGANKLIENTIREIKEQKADKIKTKVARGRIEKEKTVLQQKITAENKEKKNPKQQQKIRVGDYVKLKGADSVGEVKSIDKKNISIAFESFSFNTTIDKVELTKKPKNSKPKRQSEYQNNQIMASINEKVANFNYTLDVRGKKAEEVRLLTEQYIDEALFIGANEVEILHGKGNGILGSVVRKTLSDIPQVISYRYQHADFGGVGITIVQLR